MDLSYDFAVRLGEDGLPDPGWPPRIGREGTRSAKSPGNPYETKRTFAPESLSIIDQKIVRKQPSFELNRRKFKIGKKFIFLQLYQ
jgi:hypothetical protein